MWPLSILLLFATAVPQQKPLDVSQDFLQLKLPVLQHPQFNSTLAGKLTRQSQSNMCFTMRSYYFRHQDGQALIPAGMSTCTPASVLQQRQVSPGPPARFVPLAAQEDEQK
jgi:hypothetical protein